MPSGIKDKLMSALHTAVANFNDSSDPNAAVVKAAQAHDFNTDQTARLVEMFNSARTIYHYKTAQDRSSTFALADPAAVIPAFYDEPEKEAAAQPAIHGSYLDYDRPETDYRDNMLVKAGGLHDDIDRPGPTDHSDMSLDTMGKRAYDLMQMQKDLAGTARGEAGVAGTKAGMILTKLAQALATGYEENCIDTYRRLAGAYMQKSSEYHPVMVKLAEFLPEWLTSAVDLEKSAEDVVDDRGLETFEAQIKEAQFFMQTEAEMLAYAGSIEKEAETFNVEFTSMMMGEFPEKKAESLADFLKAGSTTRTVTQKEEGVEPLFGFGGPKTVETKSVNEPVIGKAISDAIGEGVKKPLADQVSSGVEMMLTAPKQRENEALSERLRNVQRQVMLEDLMVNNPVLMDEDPDVVANAYSTILRIAPEVASHKEVVRAILREAVHAVAIGAYDAQSFAELEKNLLQITGKMPSNRPDPRGGQ